MPATLESLPRPTSFFNNGNQAENNNINNQQQPITRGELQQTIGQVDQALGRIRDELAERITGHGRRIDEIEENLHNLSSRIEELTGRLPPVEEIEEIPEEERPLWETMHQQVFNRVLQRMTARGEERWRHWSSPYTAFVSGVSAAVNAKSALLATPVSIWAVRGISRLLGGEKTENAARLVVSLNNHRGRGIRGKINSLLSWPSANRTTEAILRAPSVREMAKYATEEGRELLEQLSEPQLKKLLKQAMTAGILRRAIDIITPPEAISWSARQQQWRDQLDQAGEVGKHIYHLLAQRHPDNRRYLPLLNEELEKDLPKEERKIWARGVAKLGFWSLLPAAGVALGASAVMGKLTATASGFWLKAKTSSIGKTISGWWNKTALPAASEAVEKAKDVTEVAKPAVGVEPITKAPQVAPPTMPTAEPNIFTEVTAQPGDSVWNLGRQALKQAGFNYNTPFGKQAVNAAKNATLAWDSNRPIFEAGTRGHWLYPGDHFSMIPPNRLYDILANKANYPPEVFDAAYLLANPPAGTDAVVNRAMDGAIETLSPYLVNSR